MLRLRLALLICLGTSCFGRPDVSHILLAQKAAATKMARQVGNFDLLLPGGPSLRLEEMQPAPFRKAGEQQGYDYAKPDISLPDNSLDVHPDSNLIKPVSTQAPEYLPPESEQQGSNIDNVVVSTTTTTTTTVAPLANVDVQQPFDENNGYGYQVPEQALSQTINEVIHEPSDINELATTTQATVSTTKRTSLEYLPPKPLPDLLGPRGPSTDRTETEAPKSEAQSTIVDVSTLSTQRPVTSQTTVSFSTVDFSLDNGNQPAVSISSEYSNPSTLAVSTTTEISSTAAPEYLPPDDLLLQSVPRSGISDVESTESESSTASPAREQPTAEPSPPVTASQGPVLDLLSTVQTTEELPAEAPTISASEPQLVEPSMISLINQLSETNQIDQQDFNPVLRIEAVEAVELSVDPVTSTTAEPRTSTEEPSSVPASAATVLDLLSTTAKDMITTYHPSSGGQVSQSNESTADGTEIQARIAPTDGYNYAVPDNGLDVPAVPSHTLDENGYHYKVPSVPFP